MRASLLLFLLCSLAAVAAGAAVLHLHGSPPSSWIRNPAAWLAGAAVAAIVFPTARTEAGMRAVAIASPLVLALSFAGADQQGVHRWINVGPLHVNPAALILPAAIVALARSGGGLAPKGVVAAIILALLVLQPDASQATAFAAAMAALVLLGSSSGGSKMAALAALALAVAAAWAWPDPLEPVPEVEGIFALAGAASPALALAAALALGGAVLAPLPAMTAGPASRREAAAALAAYFVAVASCPLLAPFPVPLVGLGMSFPIGFWLGMALLWAPIRPPR